MPDITQLSDLARVQHLRVAVAESLTSGALASTIGAGQDAGVWFAGGIVAYLPDVKERMLGFPTNRDPVSAECAEQMARAARELFDADVCVSTTGVGGPTREDCHPPGTVFVGWATRSEVGHRYLCLNGDPEEVLSATIDAAVDVLTFQAMSTDLVTGR